MAMQDGELETWQEIAAYLSVSVREAQYREKNDQMPVHRLPGRKSRVWAYRAELDEWKARNSSAPTNGSVGRKFPTRRALLGLAGTAAAAVGTAVLLRSRKLQVARASIEGNSLCAWDEVGRLAWKYTFPGVLNQVHDNRHILKRPERQVQIVDYRGDGHKQIVVATAFKQPDGSWPASEELQCFSSGGKFQWRYRPDLALPFGDTRFSGPWTVTDMMVAPDAAGKNSVWVSLAHWNWRPGAVLTIGGNGAPVVRFVSAGNVYALGSVNNASGHYVLAGGINNEYNEAALAVLRVDGQPSCSPQTSGTRFECIDGPKGLPDRYFLFPPSELNVAYGRPYNEINFVGMSGGLLTVETDEVPNGVNAIYTFSKDIEPVDVAFGDDYAVWHRRFEDQRLLKHDLADCPQLLRPTPVRRWDAKSGWRSVAVAPAVSVRPGAFHE
ncbi:MAG: hypothetical protein ABSB88_13495 [Bryobacteraceae bacterium]|jgi:hypothetical protein